MSTKPDYTLPLYPSSAPGSLGDTTEDRPWLEVYRAPNPTGAAVLICPGGGYAARAEHEGAPIAHWLNSIGVTGIVVHYRVAPYKHPQPFNDCVEAMRITLKNAAEWGIDAQRIGVLGFSAGGHLAASLSTQAPLETRPKLSILLYPVITFTDPHTHAGSRFHLLADPTDATAIQQFSNENRVDANTPPAFLFHTVDDEGVPVENSLLYAQALRKNKIPFELHFYETGAHGVGLASHIPALSTWPLLCANWLRARGWAT